MSRPGLRRRIKLPALIAALAVFINAPAVMGQSKFGDLDRSLLLKFEGPAQHQRRSPLMAPQPTPEQTLSDVIHYDVDIAIDEITHLVEGRVTAIVESLTDSLPQIDFNADAVLTILSIEIEGYGSPLYGRNGDVLSVMLPAPLAQGEMAEITLLYEGNPTAAADAGLFFRSYAGRPVVHSLSEPWGARTWWPCKDYPDDKATFDIALSVRPGLLAASNGEFIGQSDTTCWSEPFTKYRWRENYPMAPYLFSVAAAEYVLLPDAFEYAPGETMQVTNYVYPELAANAAVDLDITVPALEFFSDLYGDYPFREEKYGVALCVLGGGMEHQTLCTYGYYFMTGDHRYDWIWIHELGHQWFGDKVTCADWTHIWLNEGWASYTEALWFEHLGGPNDLRDYMEQMDSPGSWDGPVLRDPDVDDPWYYFDLVVYDKAAWVLHMLRHVMGDAAFFDATRAYVADPQFSYRSADTDQFVDFFEDFHGEPLDWFFDQWLTRVDRLTYEWYWNTWESGGRYFLSIFVRQLAPPYTMPVDFRISHIGSETDTVLWVDENEESFIIETSLPVSDVQIDPDHWILCDIVPGTTGDESTPSALYLSQNRPNPFNPSTTITFGLDRAGAVSLKVYDVRGALVKTLVEGRLEAGAHETIWKGEDSKGRPVSSGVYFYRLLSGGRELTRKMILLR